MRRKDTVVVIAGRNKRRGVGRSGPHIVIRGVSEEGLELIRILRRAKVGGPGPSDGELVEPQHVEDTHVRNACTEEVRTLRQARSYQQATVAAAADRQLWRARVAVLDEPLRRCDEVVEDVLLVQLRPCFIPGPAVLPSSAQVRLGIHASHLHPGKVAY